MSLPTVSICIPTLNARSFLVPRIESILAQTLTDWELIVCDSYSNDGAWEYLQQFNGDPRIRLYQVPKEGLYAGWNECLKRCCGEYVYIATADDTCKPELLEKMVGALEKAETLKTEMLKLGSEDLSSVAFAKAEQRTRNQEPDSQGLQSSVFSLQSNLPPLPADIAVCNFDYIDENGDVIDPPLPPAGAFYGDDRYRSHRRSGYLEFLVHLLIGTSWTTMTAVLFRRTLLEKTGLFVTNAGPLADRLWAYKSALHSDTIVVPETLATWRQHPEQGTSPRRNPSMRSMRRLWRKTVESVEECMPLLPERWLREPHFRQSLLWAEHRHYYDQYCLSRTHLRYHPKMFTAGLIKAVCLEPAYAFRRLLSGLAWEGDSLVSEADSLRSLLKRLANVDTAGLEGV